MSTSLRYHGLGIKRYQYVRTRYLNRHIWFRVEHDGFNLQCPAPEGRDVVLRGNSRRVSRTIPVGGKSVFIELWAQRIECRQCGIVRQAKIGFAEERRTSTKASERYALDLPRYMTILDVARHLGVSGDIANDIQKRHLRRRFSEPKLKSIRQIAINEITIGKGHHYLTVVFES